MPQRVQGKRREGRKSPGAEKKRGRGSQHGEKKKKGLNGPKNLLDQKTGGGVWQGTTANPGTGKGGGACARKKKEGPAGPGSWKKEVAAEKQANGGTLYSPERKGRDSGEKSVIFPWEKKNQADPLSPPKKKGGGSPRVPKQVLPSRNCGRRNGGERKRGHAA